MLCCTFLACPPPAVFQFLPTSESGGGRSVLYARPCLSLGGSSFFCARPEGYASLTFSSKEGSLGSPRPSAVSGNISKTGCAVHYPSHFNLVQNASYSPLTVGVSLSFPQKAGQPHSQGGAFADTLFTSSSIGGKLGSSSSCAVNPGVPCDNAFSMLGSFGPTRGIHPGGQMQHRHGYVCVSHDIRDFSRKQSHEGLLLVRLMNHFFSAALIYLLEFVLPDYFVGFLMVCMEPKSTRYSQIQKVFTVQYFFVFVSLMFVFQYTTRAFPTLSVSSTFSQRVFLFCSYLGYVNLLDGDHSWIPTGPICARQSIKQSINGRSYVANTPRNFHDILASQMYFPFPRRSQPS